MRKLYSNSFSFPLLLLDWVPIFPSEGKLLLEKGVKTYNFRIKTGQEKKIPKFNTSE